MQKPCGLRSQFQFDAALPELCGVRLKLVHPKSQ
jgi:hypothetical protein